MTTEQRPATAGEQPRNSAKGYRLPDATHLGKVRLQVRILTDLWHSTKTFWNARDSPQRRLGQPRTAWR